MTSSAPDALGCAAAYWSGQAVRYDRWGDLAHGHPRYRQAWTAALTALAGRPDASKPLRVAEVGTGTGELARLLAEMGHYVTGYDIAPGMLDLARTNLGQNLVVPSGNTVSGDDTATDAATGSAGRIELAQAPAHQLPLPDGSVDLVISRMVFWALTDPLAGLREWRRVLAPAGRIVVIDALHFQPPKSGLGWLRHRTGQAFWRLLEHRDRWRGAIRTAERPGSPGARWQSVAEPAELFSEAGLTGVRIDWLHEVADAQRRTAALRWRLAGLLPCFYTLTWSCSKVDGS